MCGDENSLELRNAIFTEFADSIFQNAKIHIVFFPICWFVYPTITNFLLLLISGFVCVFLFLFALTLSINRFFHWTHCYFYKSIFVSIYRESKQLLKKGIWDSIVKIQCFLKKCEYQFSQRHIKVIIIND